MGQRLRLTVFLSGETLEVGGRVVAAKPCSADGHSYAAEIEFEPLREEHATVLEGFILAQHTVR